VVPRFATNERAVALGLPRTGRIVTVAATVMAIDQPAGSDIERELRGFGSALASPADRARNGSR